MAIITERFLATHSPARRISGHDSSELRWEFPPRVGKSSPYTLVYFPKTRRFEGRRYSRSFLDRILSRKDSEKLSRMLPASEIAAATRFTITGQYPDDTAS